MKPIFVCLLLALLGPATAMTRPLVKTVDQVEIQRYLGKWYEIARIENEFQIGCRAPTAEYSANDNSTLQVVNSCIVGDGTQERVKRAIGRAWIEDEPVNSKLKISFVNFLGWWKMFARNYWILELGPVNEQGQYAFALVGDKASKYGWVLSREPVMDESLLNEVFALAERQGYDRTKFRKTDQSANLAR